MPFFFRSTVQAQRLDELSDLFELNASPADKIAVIARLARRALNVPIAAVSLNEALKNEFEARYGVPLPPVPSEVSPGSYSVPSIFQQAGIFNGNTHDRTEEEGFHFLATKPVYGMRREIIGTFWVADFAERIASEDDELTLADFACLVQQSLVAVDLQSLLSDVASSEVSKNAMLENVIDSILTINPEGLIKSVNRAAIETFGYEREEMVGHGAGLFLSHVNLSEKKQGFDTQALAQLADGSTHIFRGKRRDGSTFPLNLAITAIPLMENRCYAVFVRDSTEIQRSERAVRESARLLQSVMDSTSSYVHVRDLNGTYLYVNKEYERVFGVTKGDVIGKAIEDVFPPGLAKKYRTSERAVIESGQVARTEAVVELHDGPHTYLVVRSPLFNESGEIYGASGVGTDITLSKQSEDELKLLNRELAATTSVQEAILNSANFAIIATALDGTIRIFSAGAERMLGYRAHEMIGLHTPALLHDPEELKIRAKELSAELNQEIAGGFEALVTKVLEGHADEHEWTYIGKDGRRFPVMLSVTALWNEAAHITGFLCIAYDITERKKVESMKNEFISTVSHELRTPLTSIRGALGLVAAGKIGNVSTASKSMLDIAIINCERLARLINDILDIEKIASGNMRFEMVRQPLLPLVKEAVSAMEAYAEQLEVQLVISELSKHIEVTADADRLTQVIVNLLSNAIKFSPKGGVVHISISRREHMARFSVTDEGEGIREDFRTRVFQRFAQADASDTRRRGGTGLGLNISKAIVEKHAGRIDFYSRPGGGTEFYFELPLPHGSDTTACSSPQRYCRVLICEGESGLAQALELALVPTAIAADIAASPEQAFALMNENSYDAIVLDLESCGDTGMKLLDAIRRHETFKHLPILAISPEPFPVSVHSEPEAAPVQWLASPVDVDQFLQQVQRSAQFEGLSKNIIHIGPENITLREALNSLGLPEISVETDSSLVAMDLLTAKQYDLVLLDASVSQQVCAKLSNNLPKSNADTPIIFTSASDSKETLISRIESALSKSCHSNRQWLSTLHNLISQNSRA